MNREQMRVVIFVLLCILVQSFGCSQDSGMSDEAQGDRAFETSDYKQAVRFWIKALGKGNDPSVKPGLYHKLGKAYLNLAQINPAEKAFEQAIKINPLAHEIQLDLVRILMLKGENAAALKKLDLLKDKLEKNADFLSLYGDFLMGSNEFQQAVHMYQQAALLAKDKVRPTLKLAICLFQAGETDRAENLISFIEKNENQNPMVPLDLLLLSDYYVLVEDFARAEACMAGALENDPGNITLKIRLCQFYLTTGMQDKAEKTLVQLEEAYPEDVRFKLMLADLYLSELEMDQAEEMLKNAENTGQSPFEHSLLMGKFWLFKGKTSYAVSYLKNAIEGRPGLVSAHYLLGIAYFAGGQDKLAEKSFVQALILDPHHLETLIALAGLLYQNKDYELALQYLDKAVLLDPTNASVHMIKGLCLMDQNQDREAALDFSRAHALAKDMVSLFFLARSLQNQDKYEPALDIYGDLLDSHPDLLNVLQAYTALLVKMNQGERALERVEQTLKKGFIHPAIYYTGARICLDLGDDEHAKDFLETAMGLGDVPGYVYSLLAVMHQKKGENHKAEEVLKQCILDKPFYEKAWTDLAALYVQINGKDKALEILHQAVEKFPDNPLVLGNLAWLLLEIGQDFDQALDLARTAYEKSPGQACLMDTLGWAYFHKNAFSQAEWMLASAEALAPDNAIIKYHQGMVFFRQGKLVEAKERLTAARGHDLSEEDESQIQQVLSDLETDKTRNFSDGEIVFDPDAPLSFPEVLKEEEDILEPDWSQTLHKRGNQ